MDNNWERQKLVSNEPREEREKVSLLRSSQESFNLRQIHSIPVNMAWMDAVEFDQLVLAQKDGHVLGMLKGVRGGLPVIAYVACKTYADTLETLAEWAVKGELEWKPDQWPSKRVKAL